MATRSDTAASWDSWNCFTGSERSQAFQYSRTSDSCWSKSGSMFSNPGFSNMPSKRRSLASFSKSSLGEVELNRDFLVYDESSVYL